MDQKIVGLVGALSALAAPEAAQATPNSAPTVNDILSVKSYAELHDPIPTAVELLRAADAAPVPEPNSVQLAQYYDHHHHHHHHHHNGYWRPYYYPSPYYHHYHHHHHHHGYYYYPYGYSPY
jgi:hypothetical protein